MTSWMSSLINQQDGCLQTVARQTSQKTIATGATATNGSNERTSHAIPLTEIKVNIYMLNWLIEMLNWC